MFACTFDMCIKLLLTYLLTVELVESEAGCHGNEPVYSAERGRGCAGVGVASVWRHVVKATEETPGEEPQQPAEIPASNHRLDGRQVTLNFHLRLW